MARIITLTSYKIKGIEYKLNVSEADGEMTVTYDTCFKDHSKPKLKEAEIATADGRLGEIFALLQDQYVPATMVDDKENAKKACIECPSGFNTSKELITDAFHDVMSKYGAATRWFNVGKGDTKVQACVDLDETDKKNCKLTITLPDENKDIKLYDPKRGHVVVGSEHFKEDRGNMKIEADARVTPSHTALLSEQKREASVNILARIDKELKRAKKKTTALPAVDRPSRISFNVAHDKALDTLNALGRILENMDITPLPPTVAA